jgi:uncharacterized protein
MQSRLLNEGSRSHVLVFNRGDEVMQGLSGFTAANDIGAAHFTALGAFSEASLAFFNLETKEYDEIPVGEQVEVLNITGNLSRFQGEPRVHAHAVLGRPDGSTIGGHLLRGIVQPTLEMFVTVLPDTLERQEDAETDLPLIAL